LEFNFQNTKKKSKVKKKVRFLFEKSFFKFFLQKIISVKNLIFKNLEEKNFFENSDFFSKIKMLEKNQQEKNKKKW